MIDPASVLATEETPVVRRKKARRKLTFDRVSFFVVFLGLPLAIFLLFVVWPFVQAFYYSMTDWSGFTADMNFIGLDNYQKLLDDDFFVTAFWNNILLAVVVDGLLTKRFTARRSIIPVDTVSDTGPPMAHSRASGAVP